MATHHASQFDQLARVYEDMFALPWRKDLEAHSVLRLLGDMAGKAILDIGCGTGVYSRLLRAQGAGRVVGYDTSTHMICYAENVELHLRQGVEYTTEPPTPDSGLFDLALGVYVLPYAENYSELVELCATAARVHTKTAFAGVAGTLDVTTRLQAVMEHLD